MWAITPQGIGKRVRARAIQTGWSLVAGETFTTNTWGPDLVLGDDSASLRPMTAAEVTADQAATAAASADLDAQAALATDARADSVFTQLQSATAAQINTFVNNQFSGFTAPQRAVIKLLLQAAALVIRRTS